MNFIRNNPNIHIYFLRNSSERMNKPFEYLRIFQKVSIINSNLCYLNLYLFQYILIEY